MLLSWRHHLWRRQWFQVFLRRAEHEQLPAYEYVNALKQCCKTKDLELGKRVHWSVRDNGLDSTLFVASSLVNMYSKCGEMELASIVFHRMTFKNVVTWTCFILGYVENGESTRALELFQSMDCQPDVITYLAALKALTGVLAESKDFDRRVLLEKGTLLHERLKREGLHPNVTLSSALVELYCKCRATALAENIFKQMPQKDVVTWTCLILGYVENGECFKALEVFHSMDCEPDVVTYVGVVKACAGLPSSDMILQNGEKIHWKIRKLGLDSNNILSNSLLEMYTRSGELSLARDLFDRTVRKDVVSWTSLIRGYVENGEYIAALEVFEAMDCEPDELTYTAIVKACRSVQMAERLHRQIRKKQSEFDVVLSNALIDMYGRVGEMKLAKDVFDETDRKTIVTFTSLMGGYVENGESSKALEVFNSMKCEPDAVCYVVALKACGGDTAKGLAVHRQIKERSLESNVLVACSLVDFYSKTGDMSLALESFERIHAKDVFAWNSLLQGFVENGDCSAALDVFVNRMDCQPNPVTHTLVLKACSNLVAVPLGRLVHGSLCRQGVDQEATVATTLVNFYGKCGCMDTATHIFDSMSSSPGIVSWSALLAGYSSLGDSRRVFRLVEDMVEGGVKLDGVSFVCILTACSHAGMVEEGERWFQSMQRYGVKPSLEHYTCLVDMLGRADKLEQVVSIMESVPFDVDEAAWMAVLGACKKWNNLEVGKTAFDALVSRRHRGGAAYVLMGDLYEMT